MSSRFSTLARLCAAVCLAGAALGANALELRGFRGVSWGEGAEALGSATPTATDGEFTCYQRERENLLFGDSALNVVSYCFHQDHLVMVVLDAAVGTQALAAEFQRTYGRPDARSRRTASWGVKSSGVRAEIVSQGAAARLTIYVNQAEPALAQRLHALATAETAQHLAAGF